MKLLLFTCLFFHHFLPNKAFEKYLSRFCVLKKKIINLTQDPERRTAGSSKFNDSERGTFHETGEEEKRENCSKSVFIIKSIIYMSASEKIDRNRSDRQGSVRNPSGVFMRKARRVRVRFNALKLKNTRKHLPGQKRTELSHANRPRSTFGDVTHTRTHKHKHHGVLLNDLFLVLGQNARAHTAQFRCISDVVILLRNVSRTRSKKKYEERKPATDDPRVEIGIRLERRAFFRNLFIRKLIHSRFEREEKESAATQFRLACVRVRRLRVLRDRISHRSEEPTTFHIFGL